MMIKPEWGVKRVCPKCATRFYDLGKDDPIGCIACGHAWTAEPILKSKQPLSFDTPKPEAIKEEASEEVLDAEDLDIEEEAEPADDAAELGGDDDLSEVVDERGEEEV